MLFKKVPIFIKRIFLLVTFFFYFSYLYGNTTDFSLWLDNFKIRAKNEGISQKTIDDALGNAQYLSKVIEYDNRQPEFFEKTDIYIGKRANQRAVRQAVLLLKENQNIFNKAEKEFNVNKEILLALWSTETNFGKNLGKMDIISSLATLSFDKRRSAYFTKELLTLLKLLDSNIIKKDTLYGSWAGAVGNFQFMPSSISRHAIDYDNDGYIDLKQSKADAIGSAANYINKIGWKKNMPCFDKIVFSRDVNNKYFNHSARNISFKKKISDWKKIGINFIDNDEKKINYLAALVLPDGDASSPKFLVYDNYEIILQWNRSLRFALSVCTLAESIRNEM
jgi:membrane-bound lytic murein transglycosylase B